MTKIMVVVLFFIIIENKTFSQNNNFCGIYLTAKDYQNSNLYLKSAADDIVFDNDLALKPHYLKVKMQSNVNYFNRDSVYGYKDKDFITYRFYNNLTYQIVETSPIIVYKRYVRMFRYSRLEYFFSESANSPIFKLDKNDLEKVFSRNKKLLALLAKYKDDDLADYDRINKCCKINSIYKASLENSSELGYSK